jgi:signal transduction histidine kinase
MTEELITKNEWDIVRELSATIPQCASADEICRAAGEKIFALNPHSYVIISLFDPDAGGIRIRSIFGFSRLVEPILNITKIDPRKIIFSADDMTKEEQRLYTCGRLVQIPGGLYQLSLEKFSRKISRMIEKISGIDKVLTIGFGFEGEPYGGVIILRREGEEIRHVHLIESLVNLIKSEIYRRQAEQSNIKLKSMIKELEAFTYSVSHDLRAPLRAVKGFSRALMEDLEEMPREELIEYVNRIFDSSKKMNRLISNLLKLSRISQKSIHPQKINLSRLAEETAEELQQQYPRHDVKLIIEPKMIVHGDPPLIRVALNNLLENAWKFTQKSKSPKIEIGTIRRKERPIFFVRDNGPGFNMDYRDKLFQPFQRLHSDREFSGTGIGLATVDRIIRRHGGSIWGESPPGQGAVFYFTLD